MAVKNQYRMMAFAAAMSVAAFSLSSCEWFNSTHEKVSEKIRKESKAEPITVKVLNVGSSENIGTSSYVGTVEASKSVLIVSPVSGTLTELNVREGQSVSAGQPVARIESQTLRSTYEMANATYEQAKDGMDRLQKLFEAGSVSEVKMVEMRTNLEKAEAAVKAAAKSLEDCCVKAPFAGVVESVPVHNGVDVTIAEAIARIVDVNSVEIHFPLPENEFGKVSRGDVATVVIPALDRTVSARVANKGVVASRLSHSYDCTLGSLSDARGLMPGMVCKVYIESEAGSGIVIPSTAVMTDMEGRYVWTVKDGIVGKNHIVVGGYSGDGIIVSDGLPEGVGVIIEGARKVSTGMSVKTIE